MQISLEQSVSILGRFTESRKPLLIGVFSPSALAMFAGTLGSSLDATTSIIVQIPQGQDAVSLSMAVDLANAATREFGDLFTVSDKVSIPAEMKTLIRERTEGGTRPQLSCRNTRSFCGHRY